MTIQFLVELSIVVIYRAVGAGLAGEAVAGPILKIAPGATHGKWASRKLCNTLLGLYIKKQQIVEFMLLHSKNALEMISEDPNIQNVSGGACPQSPAGETRETKKRPKK